MHQQCTPSNPTQGVVRGAISGLKVLDLTRFIAGPYCGLLLGDMGADVIKVETPGKGENTRSFYPRIGDESLYTIVMNRNKRAMTLNFRNPAGQKVLRDLIAETDVVLENFVPGTLEKMGCGWDAMKEVNPRLIMTRISGFGSSGPYAQRPCFDIIAQAMSGLMELTGSTDGPPTAAGTFIVDYCTALYATIGTLGALLHRERTGKGQLVEATLLNSAISLLLTSIPDQLLFGRSATRHGNRDRYNAPANTFKAKDETWVLLLAVGDDNFRALAQCMGRSELADDPKYATNAARMKNVDAIEAEVQRWVSQHAGDDVCKALEAIAIPCTKVATVTDLLQNPEVLYSEQIITLDQPSGKVPVQGFAVKLSDSPLTLRYPAPQIGEHTDVILKGWLNYSEEEIARLRNENAI